METGSGYKYRTEIAFVVAFCKVLHAVMFHFSEFCLFLFHWIALLVCVCFADGFVLMCRIAGTVSSAATCPLDVAKTRLQSSLIAAGHMQVRPTLNVAGGGYAATLHASLSQPRCARPTVSIGFYHCIRWKEIFVFVPDGLIYYHWQLLLFTLCIVCGAGSVNRRRSRILQGRVSNPSERGTGGRAPKVEHFPFQWPLI